MSELENKILEIVKINPTLSNREIGKIVGKHRMTIAYYLRKNNIHRDRVAQQKLNNTDRNSVIYISDVAKQILTGTLLGDSSVDKYKRENCESVNILNSNIHCGHSMKQKEYVLYLADLLSNEGLKVNYREDNRVHHSIVCGREITTIGECYLSTTRNIEFNEWRDKWYPAGKKIVPTEFMQYLTPLAIAVWFMDDGSKHECSYYLHTDGFELKYQRYLQKILFDKFGIKTVLHKVRGTKHIYICASSKDDFTRLIRPYICKSMEYKLHSIKGSE